MLPVFLTVHTLCIPVMTKKVSGISSIRSDLAEFPGVPLAMARTAIHCGPPLPMYLTSSCKHTFHCGLFSMKRLSIVAVPGCIGGAMAYPWAISFLSLEKFPSMMIVGLPILGV